MRAMACSKRSVPMWVLTICLLYIVIQLSITSSFSLSTSLPDGNLAFLMSMGNRPEHGDKNLGLEPNLLQLNVPLKDSAKDKYQKGIETLKGYLHDDSLPSLNGGNNSKIDPKDFLQRNILSDTTFREKENFAKLLLTVDFIKHTSKGGTLNLDQLKNVLKPQNFDGQRFLFRNGQDLADKFEELQMLEESVNLTQKEIHYLETLTPGSKRYRPYIPYSPDKNLPNKPSDKNAKIPAWKRLHSHITPESLYKPDDPALNEVLHDMRTQQIVNVTAAGGGTQIKFILYFANGGKALFKPMRNPRNQEMLPNHFYFSDFERHTSEIGASLVDRVLELNRAPPVVGRVLNITRDLERFAKKKMLQTFFISPAGNICFYGDCSYYCDASHAICGNPEMLEGSVAYFMPEYMPRSRTRHPWRRSYNKGKKATWEKHGDYCHNLRNSSHAQGRRFLDIMDLSVFDFLIQNLDRHHYEYFSRFRQHSAFTHFDHGRSFGKAFFDQLDCLAPVYQCCLVRYSMLKKLLKFNQGPVKLSEAVRTLGADDLIAPVLLEQHLVALDRRVKIILKVIYKCIEKNGDPKKVVIDDGF